MKASTGGMDASMVVIETHNTAEEDAAATKLQASFKGHMGRKKVKSMKEEKAKEEKEKAQAATKVQSSFRGHKARKEVSAKKAAVAAPPAEEAAPAEAAPAE